MRLDETLSELREDQGLTQLELSTRLHISNSSISAYETGARLPNVEVLAAFADFFDVTTDYLLGRTEDSVSPSVLSEEFVKGVKMSSVLQTLKMFTPDQKCAILTVIESMRFYTEVTGKTTSNGVNKE